jgi:hypothetical protein
VNIPLDDAGTVHYNTEITWDLLSPTALSPEAFAANCAVKFGLCASAAAALAASVAAQIEHHLDRLPMSYRSKVQPARPLQSAARAGRPKKAAPARAAAPPRPAQQPLAQQQRAQQQHQQQVAQAAYQQRQQQLALAAQAAAQLPPARQMNYMQKVQQQQHVLPPPPSLAAYQAQYQAVYKQAPTQQQQAMYRVVGQGCSTAPATEQQMQALLLRRRVAGCVVPRDAVVAQGPCHLCRVSKSEVFSCCSEGCVSHALCEMHLMIE